LELFDELTALENIQLKNRLTGHKSASEIIKLAEILEISGFMNRKTEILSFGQKQRVAIIRALCQPFNFLLADEIFSHLDDVIREKALEVITDELENQGAGILFTSLKESENGFFNKKYRV
ncbi:MAG: ATP-binding cassette domain-containing protein, partial [Bacteroidales bacterium]